MKKSTIITTLVVALGLFYAYKMYNKKKTKVVKDGSMEYEIDLTQTTS
jgi:predicted negative regulator of RcsB-dependent stress response